MIDFIAENWVSVLICCALVAVIAFLLARGKKEIVYKMLYSLVDEAEEIFGSGTGKRKFAYVMEQAYAKLPAIVRLVVTYSTLEKWIEKALAKWKEDLAEKVEVAE